jgi:four helix bundle protein
MRDFKKYEVWQTGHQLCLEVYSISKSFPKEELYGLTSQLRRAALSIPTNISEGCGRTSEKEFAHFLNISLGSAHEIENLFIIAKDLTYLNEDDYKKLNEKINLIKKKIYHLHKTLINKT